MDAAAPVRFECHRGIQPMLWVFVALAAMELLVVHLFVALRWPATGWPLSIASALSIAWLVFWTNSFRTRPYELDANMLRLHFGSLRSLDLPLSNVASVRSSWARGEHKGREVANLVPVAYPNRLIELVEPIGWNRRSVCRAAIRLDDPPAFDSALRQRGIAVQ